MKNKKIVLLICMTFLMVILAGCSKNDSKEEEKDDGIIFSKDGGSYEEEFVLELSSEEEGEIYYTLDGSSPANNPNAIKYEDGIKIRDRKGDSNYVSAVEPSLFSTNFSTFMDGDVVCYLEAPTDDAVDKCTVIKATLKDSTGEFQQVFTQTYFIGSMEEHIEGIKKSCDAAGQKLAVISISMEYQDLFDPETGIYVKGNIFDESLASNPTGNDGADAGDTRKYPANYNQRGREWEREAHIDFFESDGNVTTLALSQDCGIRIQGNFSRSDVQKSFRLYAREEYGDKRFRYELFGEDLKDKEGKTIDTFKTFIVRNGGNCAFDAKFNDTYWQTLVAETTDCDTQKSRPCVVYLNGEYWGLYVMEEDYSSEYFEDHYGVEKDDVVLYKGDAETYELGFKLDLGELPEDSSVEQYYLLELREFFRTHKNITNDADYAEFEKMVDIESLIDYFAVEVWINNKWDWPGKNWSMWKTINVDENNEYADGRWRFTFYDTEFGGNQGSGDAKTNTIKVDNYQKLGLLDTHTRNPLVLCFAYLMSNDKGREQFCNRILELTGSCFEKENAEILLKKFEDTYGPLYDQFFERYPDTGSKENALNGWYQSSRMIREFIEKRADYIQPMLDWANEQYK